jgi:hypothetical protein
VRLRPRGAIIRVMAMLAAAAVLIGGCGATPSIAPPSGGSPAAGPSPSLASSVAPAVTSRPLTTDEQAFADAFTALADEHDRAMTELLIANPLAEWDLVGVPLAARVTAFPDELAGLPALPLTRGLVDELAGAIASTGALLTAIDPHGPRVSRATAYGHALDDWIEHVLPVDLELRARLGLPPPASGDLRL